MNIGTIARTIATTLAQINMCLCTFGVTNFENVTEDMIYTVVSVIVTIVTTAVGHYKNNDFSKEAAEGTGLTRLLKQLNKAQQNGVEFNGENFFDEVEEMEEGVYNA